MKSVCGKHWLCLKLDRTSHLFKRLESRFFAQIQDVLQNCLLHILKAKAKKKRSEDVTQAYRVRVHVQIADSNKSDLVVTQLRVRAFKPFFLGPNR